MNDRTYSFNELTARQVAARAKVHALLARMFSYPDRIEAMAYTSEEFLGICEGFARRANLSEVADADVLTAFRRASQADAEERATDLRAEYTRLFVAPPRPVRLTGSRWVRTRTLVSEERGERFAVGAVYRELGLRTKKGVPDPPDHLVSELDCTAYILRAEARAWREDDLAMARDWRQLREDFLTFHLSELALGVSDEVLRMSENPHLRYFAALLATIAE